MSTCEQKLETATFANIRTLRCALSTGLSSRLGTCVLNFSSRAISLSRSRRCNFFQQFQSTHTTHTRREERHSSQRLSALIAFVHFDYIRLAFEPKILCVRDVRTSQGVCGGLASTAVQTIDRRPKIHLHHKACWLAEVAASAFVLSLSNVRCFMRMCVRGAQLGANQFELLAFQYHSVRACSAQPFASLSVCVVGTGRDTLLCQISMRLQPKRVPELR